jgi:hypothetical protein
VLEVSVPLPAKAETKIRNVGIHDAKASTTAARGDSNEVKDIMTAQPLTCAPDTSLAAAAALFWMPIAASCRSRRTASWWAL